MRRSVAALVVMGLLLAASPSASAVQPAGLVPPDTPVGRQVAWLVEVSGRLPMSQTEAEQHLNPQALAAIGLDALNQTLAQISGPDGLTLLRYEEQGPQSARFLVEGAGRWLGGVSVDDAGLVASLTLAPFLAAPGSWQELDQRLQSLAPRVSLLAARLDEPSGDCETVHGVEPTRAFPLGSGFKLYVLGALAHEIAAGRAAWDESLAIRDDWKSLPTGVLQDVPAGTEVPLRTYADLMIEISDNTATDHLMHRLGRQVVERQLVRFDIDDPRRNRPLLTTREFFTLKLTHYPTLLRIYRHLPSLAQRAFLHAVVNRKPLPSSSEAEAWTSPRGIDSVEWFGSPTDICHAFAGLRRQAATPGLDPVDHALSLNDGGLWLDPQQWSSTWFKGGSEPGVLTLHYLAHAATGETYVVSGMLADARAPLPGAAAFELQALIRGAFALASGEAVGSGESASSNAPPAPAMDATDGLGPLLCAPAPTLGGGGPVGATATGEASCSSHPLTPVHDN